MAYDDQDDLFGEDFDFVDEDELDGEGEDRSDLEDSELDDDGCGTRDGDPREASVEQSPKSSSKEKEPVAAAEDQQEKPASRSKRRPRRGKSASTTHDSRQPDRSKSSQEEALDDDLNETARPDTPEADDNREEAEVIPEGPPTDHIVHVYELGKFKRTIQREFTAEDAEAFAVEYNRTSKPYSRSAIALAREDDPASTV